MRVIVAVALVLAGCASSKVWVKEGSSTRDFNVDAGQCKAQAFAVPGAPLIQVSIVYNACMEGKGWQLQNSK